MRTAKLVAIILVTLAVVRVGASQLGAPADDADKAAFERARQHVQDKKYDKARDELLALIKTGRENRWVGLARLGLAEVYEVQGDEAAMLRQLEVAAGEPGMATERGIMDTSDTRQEAIKQLGKHYLSKGEYKKAFAAFTRIYGRSPQYEPAYHSKISATLKCNPGRISPPSNSFSAAKVVGSRPG